MSQFIVYDERAWTDPDRAAVLVACETAAEAKSYGQDPTYRGVVYEYDVEGDRLTNPKLRADLSFQANR